MNKQETIKLLREWGNGDFSRLGYDFRGICANAADEEIDGFDLMIQFTGTPCPIDNYCSEKSLGTLWQNPKRLQLCLDFADWLEERE